MAQATGGGEVDSIGSVSVQINIDEEAFEQALAAAEAKLHAFVSKEWKVNLEAAFGENSSLIQSIKDAARVGDDESRRQAGNGSGGERNAADVELNAKGFAEEVRRELEGTPLRITLDQQFLRSQFESALSGFSAPGTPNTQQALPGSPAGVVTGNAQPAGFNRALSGEGGESVMRLYNALNEARRALGQSQLSPASSPAEAYHSIVRGHGRSWREIGQFPDDAASEPASSTAIGGLLTLLRKQNGMGQYKDLIDDLIHGAQSAESAMVSAAPHYDPSRFGTPSQSETIPSIPAAGAPATTTIGPVSPRQLQSEAMRRVATNAERVLAQMRYQAGLEEQAGRAAPQTYSLNEITRAALMDPTLVRVPGQPSNVRQYADRRQVQENAEYALGQIMAGLEARGRDPGMLGASSAYFTSGAAPIRYEEGQDPISHLMLQAAGGAYEYGGSSMPLPHRVQGLFSGQTPSQAYRSAGLTSAQSFEAWMGSAGEWNDPGLPPGKEHVATVNGEEVRWRDGDLPPSVRERLAERSKGRVVGPRAGPNDVFEPPYIEMGGRGENFSPARMVLPRAGGGEVELPASFIRAIEHGAFTRMAAPVRDDNSLDLENLWPLMLDMDEEGNLPIARPGGRVTRNGVRYERVKQRTLLKSMLMNMGVDEEVVESALSGSVPETHAMKYGDVISRLGKSIDYGASTFTTRSLRGASDQAGTPQVPGTGSSQSSLYRLGRDYSRSLLPRNLLMRQLEAAKRDLQALMDLPGSEFTGLGGRAAQEQIAYLTELSQKLSMAENQLAYGPMPFTSEYDSTLNAQSREAIEMGAYGGVGSDTLLRPVSYSERRRELEARLQAMPTEQELALPISALATDMSPHEQFKIMRMRAEREVIERELAHLNAPLGEEDRAKVNRELEARAERPELADIEAQLLAIRDVAGAGGLDVSGAPIFVPGIKKPGMGYYDRPGKIFTGLSTHEGLSKMLLDIVTDPDLGIMDLIGNPRIDSSDPFAVGNQLERNPATAMLGRLLKGIITDEANKRRYAMDTVEPSEKARETRASKSRMKSEAPPYRAQQEIGDIEAILGVRADSGVPGRGLRRQEQMFGEQISGLYKQTVEGREDSSGSTSPGLRSRMYQELGRQPTEEEIGIELASGEGSSDYREAKAKLESQQKEAANRIAELEGRQAKLRQVMQMADELLGKHDVETTDEYGRTTKKTEYNLPMPKPGEEGNYDARKASDTVIARANLKRKLEGADEQILSMAQEEALRQLRFRDPAHIGENIVINGPDLRTPDETRAAYQQALGSELPTGEGFGNMQGPPGGDDGGGNRYGDNPRPFSGLLSVWIKGPFPLAVRLAGRGTEEGETSNTVAASSGQDAQRGVDAAAQGNAQQRAVVAGAEITAPPEPGVMRQGGRGLMLEESQGRLLSGEDGGYWASPLSREDTMTDRELKAAGLARQRRIPTGRGAEFRFASGVEPASGPIQWLNAGEVGPLAEQVTPQGGLSLLGNMLSQLEARVTEQARREGRDPAAVTVDRENRAAQRPSKTAMAKAAPSQNVLSAMVQEATGRPLATIDDLEQELYSTEGTMETMRKARAVINQKRRQLPSRAPSTMMVQLSQSLIGGLDKPFEQIAEAEQAMAQLGTIGAGRRRAQAKVDVSEANLAALTQSRDFYQELFEETKDAGFGERVEALTKGIAKEEMALAKATKVRDDFVEAEEQATEGIIKLAQGAVTGGDILKNLGAGFIGGVAGGLTTLGISTAIQAIMGGIELAMPAIDQALGGGMQVNQMLAGLTKIATETGGSKSAVETTLSRQGFDREMITAMRAVTQIALAQAGAQRLQEQADTYRATRNVERTRDRLGLDEATDYTPILTEARGGFRINPGGGWQVGESWGGPIRDVITDVLGGQLGGLYMNFNPDQESIQQSIARIIGDMPTQTIDAGSGFFSGAQWPWDDETIVLSNEMLDQFNEKLGEAGDSMKIVTRMGGPDDTTKKFLMEAGAGDLEAMLRHRNLTIEGIKSLDDMFEALNALNPEVPSFSGAFQSGLGSAQLANQVWGIYQSRDLGMRMNAQSAGLNSFANPIMPFGMGTYATGSKYESQAGAIYSRNAETAFNYEEAGLADLESMLAESLDPANAETLIADLKVMRQELYDLNMAGAEIQKAQAWRNYAQQVKVAKWQVADLVAITGKGEGSVIGQMQRENMLLQRRSQLLGFQQEQRRINFQVAVAGFNSIGLTGEERAMRLKIAQKEAGIAQEQLDINRTVGGNEFQIVQRQNDRALQQATFALQNLRASFAEQQDMAKISQAIQVTNRALGQNLKDVQTLQSAEQQMLELEKQYTQDQANAANTNLLAGKHAKQAATWWKEGVDQLEKLMKGTPGVFGRSGGQSAITVNVNVEGHVVDIDKLTAKVEKAIGEHASVGGAVG